MYYCEEEGIVASRRFKRRQGIYSPRMGIILQMHSLRTLMSMRGYGVLSDGVDGGRNLLLCRVVPDHSGVIRIASHSNTTAWRRTPLSQPS